MPAWNRCLASARIWFCRFGRVGCSRGCGPAVVSGDNAGIDEASVRSSETMHFGEAIEAEAGSDVVAAA